MTLYVLTYKAGVELMLCQDGDEPRDLEPESDGEDLFGDNIHE